MIKSFREQIIKAAALAIPTVPLEPINIVCDTQALLEIRDFLADVAGGAEITERSRDAVTGFVSIMDSLFGSHWSCDDPRFLALDPVTVEACAKVADNYSQICLMTTTAQQDEYGRWIAGEVAKAIRTLIAQPSPAADYGAALIAAKLTSPDGTYVSGPMDQVLALLASPPSNAEAVLPEELEAMISDRSASHAADAILAEFMVMRRPVSSTDGVKS